MKRLDELNQAGSCLNKAEDDEPIFVIRAKDPIGASTVRQWALEAERSGQHRPAKVANARALATQMDDWRRDLEDGIIVLRKRNWWQRLTGRS